MRKKDVTSWTNGNSISFKWLEALSSKIEKNYGTFPSFRGFINGNLKVNLGDFILIRCYVGANGIDDFDVARLLSCYDSDLGGNGLDQKCEVLLDLRKFDNDIDLETVVQRCYVKECSVEVLPATYERSLDASPGCPVYVCRLSYDENKRTGPQIKPLEKFQNHRAAIQQILDSPGKENIPPDYELCSSSKFDHKSRATSTLCSKRSCKQPRIALAVFTKTVDSATASPLSNKTPKRNLELDFEKMDQIQTDPSHYSDRAEDATCKILVKKLDNCGISSALEQMSDSSDDEVSDCCHKINQRPSNHKRKFIGSDDADIEANLKLNNDIIHCHTLTPRRGRMPPSASRSRGTPTGRISAVKGAVRGTPEKKKFSAAATPKSRCRSYQCHICEQIFYKKSNLEDHLEDDHDIYQASSDETPTPKKKKKKSANNYTNNRATPRSKKNSGIPRHRGGEAAESSQIKLTPARAVRSKCTDKNSLLQSARERLHVSAVPDSLPCREVECQELYSYIEAKLNDRAGGCMYISGVPGTGKTATVREVVRLLRVAEQEGDVPNFKFVEVNALRLVQPRQVWVEIWRALSGDERVTPEHAAQLLEKRFRHPGPRSVPTLLLVDELDLLWTRKQDVLYNLFEWPNQVGSRLIVVAIANTMDLPERVMMARVASRLGLTRVTFHPYTHHQLQTIVLSRLMGIEGFDSDAVQLVARKVAAVSGDARRALDICRRAAELAVTHASSTSPSKAGCLVGLKHVDLALKEMFTSPYIMAVIQCSDMEKLVLRAVVADFLQSGVEETTVAKLYSQLLTIAEGNARHFASLSVVRQVVNRLAAQRLLISDTGSKHMAQRIALNVSVHDVSFALKHKSEATA